jgi:hypothetical protein
METQSAAALSLDLGGDDLRSASLLRLSLQFPAQDIYQGEPAIVDLEAPAHGRRRRIPVALGEDRRVSGTECFIQLRIHA